MSEQAVFGLGAGSGDGEWVKDFMLTEPGQRHSIFRVAQAGGVFLNLPYPSGITTTVGSGGSNGLTASTKYFYVVTALNQNGETIQSLEVSGLTTVSNKAITVAWSAVVGATSYNIYRSPTSGTYGATSFLINELAGTLSYVDDGTASLTSGTPPTATTAYVLLSSAFPANQLGRAYSNVTAGGVATAAGTSAQILGTYTIPTGILAATGQGIKIRAWGSTAANANAKTMALTFGATTVATCNGTTSGANWSLEAEVYRNAATTQVAIGKSIYNATIALTESAPAETLANAIVATFTATDGTNSASDITMKGFVVELVG